MKASRVTARSGNLTYRSKHAVSVRFHFYDEPQASAQSPSGTPKSRVFVRGPCV